LRRPAVIAAVTVLCAAPSFSQSANIHPLQIPAGSVVQFQLQSRLSPSATDVTDALPPGTPLHIKLLDPIDSRVEKDGSAFQGILMDPLEQNNHVVVGANAEVHGVLALLRSRQHPEGFRYELLVTSLVDGGKSYVVTASLDSSLFEQNNKSASAQPASSGTEVASASSGAN
jgi:hypothetical protein